MQRHGVIAVSGASAGVGRAVARQFADRAGAVALLARGEEGLAAAARDVERAGARALTVPVDVADAQAVDRAVKTVERELGAVDVWVNAAFASVLGPFMDIEPEEFTRVTDVCYHGYVHCTRSILRRMLDRDRGTVVQVGSALAFRGIPLQSAYCGAKHALRGFNDSLRAELTHAEANVHVTEVHLPAVNTPQFSWARSRTGTGTRPVPPVYQPEVAARAIVFAADHPRRREYWVGVSTVMTILGQRTVPGLLDRYLASTGFGAQKRQGVAPPRRDNLFHPLDDDRDYGSHGEFDGESRSRSAQSWLNERRKALALGIATAVAVPLVAVLGNRRTRASRSCRRR
ncbi:SDR family oxidoreductase [Nocardiopsis nanhaiensis]